MQRAQPPGGSSAPIREGRAVESDALTRIDLGLAIKGRVIGVLCHDHMGNQGLGRQTALDQPRRSRCLYHGARTGAASVFRPADHEHAELQRNDIEPLGNVLADPMERARATGAASVFNIDHHVDTRQIFRQSPSVDLALAGRPALPWCCGVLLLSFGRGDTLREIFQAERQLIGIELLRSAAKAMTLQRHDDRSQPVTFRGMLRPFGDEQRTQRFGVSRKIVEIGGHIFDVPYRATSIEQSRATHLSPGERTYGLSKLGGTRR